MGPRTDRRPRARFRIAGMPTAWALAALALASGCKAPPRFTLEDFREPPRAWTAVDADGGAEPAAIRAPTPGEGPGAEPAALRNGRLLLSGSQVFRDDLALHVFRGACDLTITGGILDGSAGIFVEEKVARPEGQVKVHHYTLAVNGVGQWKAYRGFPDKPLGVPVWASLPDPNPGAPLRLGASYGAGTVRFSIGGKEVASFRSPSAPAPKAKEAKEDGPQPAAETEARVGVFTAMLAVAVDRFAFGEDGEDGPFDPAKRAAADPAADAAEGEALLAEAKAKSAAFEKRPTRAGLLAALEAYTSAERAFRRTGDPARAEAASAEVVNALVALEKPARAARSDDLVRLQARARALPADVRQKLVGKQVQAFAERARAAEAAGRPAEALISWLAAAEVDRNPEAEREAARIRSTLEPLTFRYAVREECPPSKEFPRQALFAASRDIYGSLPSADDAEVKLEFVVKQATVDHEEEASTRKYPISVSESPMPAALRSEVERLEKSFPEDIIDAVARAKTLTVIDLYGRARLTQLAVEGRTVEVTVDDAKKLRATAARLAELRAKREAERATVKEYVDVRAKLITDSARLQVAYRLAAGGHEVADTVEAYAGKEQWSHPADKARGIPAASYSPEDRDRMVAYVRDRVLGRLRNAIARERILEKLSPDEATRFIIRFARTSGEDRDREMLAYRLKSIHKLEGTIRDRVLEGLLQK